MSVEPLGIIAGAGAIPLAVADAAVASGRPLMIFGIVGEADETIEAYPHLWLRIGEIGRLFEGLRRNSIRQVVLAGAMMRPDIGSIRFDFTGLASLPRLLSLLQGGDDAVLRGLIRFLEEKGYSVVGAHEVAPDLLAAKGLAGRVGLPRGLDADLTAGFAAVEALGRLDIGQSAVAVGGRVVAVEGLEGTDGLLERVAGLRASGRLRSKRGEGLLVKAPKPGQDLRVDLPTIGPATVEAAARAGLAGIALAAGRVMIADRPRTVEAADRAGLFLLGRETTW